MYVAPRPKVKNDPLFAVRLAFGTVCALIIAVAIQSQMPMLIPSLTIGLMAGMRKAFDIKKAVGGPLALIVMISFLLVNVVSSRNAGAGGIGRFFDWSISLFHNLKNR